MNNTLLNPLKKDFKILIVVPKYLGTSNKRNYGYFFPLGSGYMVSALKKNKYSVDCINLNNYDKIKFLKDFNSKIKEKIEKIKQ